MKAVPTIFAAIVVLSLATCATAVTAPVAAPFTTSGAFFAVSVPDLEASRQWYTDKLGLTLTMTVPRSDATRSSVAVLRGGGLMVELVRHDDAAALKTGEAVLTQGFFKVGFQVDDFQATMVELRARGVEIFAGPFPGSADQPANVIVRDNSGNLIQVLGK